MLNCPCGSLKSYSFCCEPILAGNQSPATPEALMRSRYTAYSMVNMDYIKETMRGKALIGFQEREAKRWAKRVIWIKLNVFKSLLLNESTAYVEFEAIFVDVCRLKAIHEYSEFRHEANRWYYVSGTALPPRQTEAIINRITPCPCGSQRKFKNCHGHKLVR